MTPSFTPSVPFVPLLRQVLVYPRNTDSRVSSSFSPLPPTSPHFHSSTSPSRLKESVLNLTVNMITDIFNSLSSLGSRSSKATGTHSSASPKPSRFPLRSHNSSRNTTAGSVGPATASSRQQSRNRQSGSTRQPSFPGTDRTERTTTLPTVLPTTAAGGTNATRADTTDQALKRTKRAAKEARRVSPLPLVVDLS